ncbi:MAG: dethiobiotin synthase [Planctomycetota bacterium]|nr:MAG: dethiobiotin synthase [Planctomycetota bacterium]
MRRGLFITGTDTGVGKTTVSCAVVRSLIRTGEKIFVAKPLATGCELDEAGQFPHPDELLLNAALGETARTWVGFRSRWPAAPSMAARWDGRRINLDNLVKEMFAAMPLESMLVVEGAGGLLCPAGHDWTMIDLAARLELPLLVVARCALGTLNHTLLTLEVANQRGLRVAGVVLNQDRPINGRAEAEAGEELGFLTKIPILGVIPHLDTACHALDCVNWRELMG